jgi:hypothetical protein
MPVHRNSSIVESWVWNTIYSYFADQKVSYNFALFDEVSYVIVAV